MMIRGLGDAATTTAQVSTGAEAALATAAAGVFGAGAQTAATAWIPIVGPIIAGVAIALTAFFNRKGPKQKIASTAIVDELEPILAQNRDAYLAAPTAAKQRAALENFDRAWDWLVSPEACGDPALGNPGKRCLSDRARGGPWDWYRLYRDPIEQTSPSSTAAGNQTNNLLWPAAAAALILAGVLS